MLRKPSGLYQVSICKIDTDYIGTNEYKRKLSLMIFYPSVNGNKACPYMDAKYQKNVSLGQYTDNGVDTYCFANGQLNPKNDKYPVVIYNHGLMGFQMESTVLCADVASEGYVVVSVGHPFGSGAVTYTNGQIFSSTVENSFDEHNLNNLGNLWKEDISCAIDYIYAIENGGIDSAFRGRLDVSSGVHLMGVSFGGCCSVAMALQSKYVIDAINLDGGLFVDLDPVFKEKPILVLRSFLNYKANRKLDQIGCVNVTVEKFRKVSHWEFSDGIYFSKKGKNNRDWANRISKKRADLCLDFFKSK